MRVLAVAVLFLLAGCTSPVPGATDPAEDPPEPTDGADPSPTGMTQSGCASFYSHHTAESAWAQSRMPDGFAHYPRGDGAWFTTKTWACGSGTVAGAAVDVGVTSLHYLAVQPPEDLLHEAAVFYWLPLEIMAEDDGLAMFTSWGFPASRLQGRTFDHADAGSVERLHAEAASDRGSALTVDVAISQQAPGKEFLVRYFAARDGVVTGALDITVHAGTQGSGTAVLDLTGPDAPFSGPTPGDGAFQGWSAGELSYTWTFVPL